ncbi:B12-binding domain-containing radical SAM protein [Streptomyces lancefieldiae]|uniref:Radical SAM protein n=1 Tax=Streptomyces lancefieldiae TaxID=3075520 RepID=A0ABU3B2I4_9ACTN|nr:radical SAM protein [Streptomyces sp. DSM 40712]MDT0616052.1 radical SAM protein [Streptomyces sp. DSM 40712]
MSIRNITRETEAGTQGRKKVVLVEIPTYENILPLASGYIQACAQDDEAVAAAYSFEIVSSPVTEDRHKLLEELAGKYADVYTFSCYIWNMKLVRWVVKELRERQPDAHYLLGGPQVMNHAATYLADAPENVSVCNGEGERTSLALLKQLMSPEPDLSQVPGLSFWSGGELVTTERAPRINNLMEIPSPFLKGVFDGYEFSMGILETNRGCPFRCTFCYWGAHTNSKVVKFEEERIREELNWISDNGLSGLFIADANWGQSPRDVEMTKHIVERSKETGYPLVVYMAAAKNRPERMSEITEIFVRGGLMVTQPISLQTLSPKSLDLVDRANIREDTFVELQRTLREKRISSYVELIWPLPGETFESFKEGLTKLCRSYADTVIVYPQLLLNNTPMYDQRELYGLTTEHVPSDVSEAEVVVATNWVSKDECREGYWLYNAMHTIYNMRGLFLLSGYLDTAGIVSYGDLFADVARYFRGRTDSDVLQLFTKSLADLTNYDVLLSGKIGHMILSTHREEFDMVLADYVTSQEWWSDPMARQAFEMDLIARPYIYREVVRVPDYEFSEITVHGLADPESFVVEVSAELARLLTEREVLDADAWGEAESGRVTLRINHHARQKMPYMPQRSLEHNANYCHGTVLRFREILPFVEVHTLEAVSADR